MNKCVMMKVWKDESEWAIQLPWVSGSYCTLQVITMLQHLHLCVFLSFLITYIKLLFDL